MKLIIVQFPTHVEVKLIKSESHRQIYTFDNLKLAEAFCTGFNCARIAASEQVQSLTIHSEMRKA